MMGYFNMKLFHLKKEDLYVMDKAQIQKIQGLYTAQMLRRVERLFGDARKVYRFFAFLEMVDILRHIKDEDKTIRLLRRMRVGCFFFFYLLENYVVFLVRIDGRLPSNRKVKLIKRIYMTFWFLSIIIAFPLDYLLHRGTWLSTSKKLLDLPVAISAISNYRLGDGMFTTLGLLSAKIGLYLHWINVVNKIHQETIKKSKSFVIHGDVE
jgi:hypothetical protein